MSAIDLSTHPLLTCAVIERLGEKNVRTIHQFIDGEVKNLVSITGLTFKNILVIKKHIFNKKAAVIRHGDDYYKDLLKHTAIIPTGITCLDTILEGGFYTGNIYELCGLPSTGKTQFCHHLAAKYCQQFNQKVLYIDTKSDFSPKRLVNFVNEDKGKVLKNILIQKVTDPYILLNVLHKIRRNFKVRVIIIDSLPTLMYQIGDMEKGNKWINNLVNVLRFVASEFHVVFVIVNTLTTWVDVGDFNAKNGCSKKPGCGKRWNTVPNTRLEFVKLKNEGDLTTIEAKVMKSSQIKEGLSCMVTICDDCLK